jgi:hypothetical protein
MKQKLVFILIFLMIAGCGPSTPVVIPNVDSGGFLKQVDNRLVYNDWPVSLILPEPWPVANFSGEVLDENSTKTVFVRDALSASKNPITLTVTFHKVPENFDAALYSIALQRQYLRTNSSYFSTIEKKSIADPKVGIGNSIFYITSDNSDGVARTFYIVHATKNQIGVELILEAETNSLKDVSAEFDSILGSLQFEN